MIRAFRRRHWPSAGFSTLPPRPPLPGLGTGVPPVKAQTSSVPAFTGRLHRS